MNQQSQMPGTLGWRWAVGHVGHVADICSTLLMPPPRQLIMAPPRFWLQAPAFLYLRGSSCYRRLLLCVADQKNQRSNSCAILALAALINDW